MSQQIEKNELDNIPSSWPGAFGAYKFSKAAVLFNWKTLVGLALIGLVISAVMGILDPADPTSSRILTASENGLSMVVNLVTAAVSVFLSVSGIIIILANINRKQIQLVDAFKQSLGYVVNYFLMAIVQSVIVFVSLLLFIVPFFFVMPRLVLSPYFLIDQKLGPIESIRASWNATRGNAAKVWGIIGATIVMALLMVTIVGIPFSIYFLFMYSAVYGLLYKFLTAKAAEV